MSAAAGTPILNNNGAGATTVTLALTCTAGGSATFIVYWDSARTLSTVGSSQGKTYTQRGTQQTLNGGFSRVYTADGMNSGAETITVTFSGACVAVIAGIPANNVSGYDAIGGPTSDGTSPWDSANATPTTSDTLFVSMAINDSSNASTNWTAQNGFTDGVEEGDGSTKWPLALGFKVGTNTADHGSWIASQGTNAIVWTIAFKGLTSGTSADTSPRDQSDGVASGATLAIAATGAPLDQGNGVAGSMSLATAITGAPGDLSDGVTSGTTLTPLGANASAALAEQGNSVTSAATLATAITGAPAEQGNGVSGSMAVATAITGAPADQGNGLSSDATTVLSTAVSAALADGVDQLVSSAGPGVLLTSINTSSAYIFDTTPPLIVGDRVELLSVTGGPTSDITINDDATWTLASGSAASSFTIRVWSITDQAWSAPATQFVSLFGASSLSELADQVVATGGPTIGATSALAEAPNGITAGATEMVGVSATVQDLRETATSGMTLAVGTSGALRDLGDTVSGASALSIVLTGSLQDVLDELYSNTGAQQTNIDGAPREGGDSVASSLAVTVGASASIQDRLDQIAAAATEVVSVTASMLELGNGSIALVVGSVQGVAALTEQQLQLIADAAIALACSITLRDRSDILSSALVYVVPEASGGFVAELVLAERRYTLNIDQRVFTLSNLKN